MANYDNKLADWFKQVENSAKQLKEKKTAPSNTEEVNTSEIIESVSLETPVKKASVVEVASLDFEDAVVSEPIVSPKEGRRMFVEGDNATGDLFNSASVDEGVVSEPKPYTSASSESSEIFDDSEMPEVEDFLSFLGGRKPSEVPINLSDPPVSNLPTSPILSKMSEGTGEPIPISDIVFEQVPEVVEEALEMVSAPAPVVEQEEVKVEAKAPVAEPEAQDNWEKVPHHLQTLFSSSSDEIAQNSYQTFKETRGELIQRLLDPVISLEEAARVLNVCPTTVRRYTNRGVLKHIRTAGNQRRFRLSDVLVFMENGTKRGKENG